MDFTTADLCDRFAAELQIGEPLFRDYGGKPRFAGQVATTIMMDPAFGGAGGGVKGFMPSSFHSGKPATVSRPPKFVCTSTPMV